MEHDSIWRIWSGRLGTKCIAARQYSIECDRRQKTDWCINELNVLQREGFEMKHYGILWIWLGRIGTEWIRMDHNVKICYETWWDLTNQISTESNWIYCNVKVSIWNVMRGDEYDQIVNKRNGLQWANMIWYGMG